MGGLSRLRKRAKRLSPSASVRRKTRDKIQNRGGPKATTRNEIIAPPKKRLRIRRGPELVRRGGRRNRFI